MKLKKILGIPLLIAALGLIMASTASLEGVRAESEAAEEEGEEVETFEFQAEVSRLMDIIINSLYTKREIYLREVISNAADALDKIRFLSLQDESVLGEGENRDLDIRISFDKDDRTLTIRDRGIGMTKEDLIQNLGTVARSGTAQFVESLASGGDLSQIGQFGVGFYSVYLVADKVTVRSKHADDEQHVWESAADGTFSIWADDEGEDLGRGTEIKLHLKDDAKEFTDQKKLEKLIRRYSEFINFPIYLRKERQETREVADEDATETEDEDEVQVEDEEEEKEKKTETVTVHEWVLINDQPAIWTRSKNDITEEEYKNFYKSITKDSEDPLTWIHFKAEGEIEFRSILYVPNTAPPGLYEDYYGKSTSLRLYVRKVLISDEFEDIMPRYLNFIKGMVDSDDLPLNVSRETLQQNRVIKAIKKKLVRKALEMLRKLAEEDEDDEEEEDKEEGEEEEEKEEKKSGRYIRFWKQFGKSIKLGLLEDTGNKSKLAKLLRYKSTKTVQEDDDVYTSLDKYVKNMKPWQNEIYYIAGESIEAVQNSPFLERFRAKDVEVLYMIDPLDEYALQQLQDYEGHKLQSVTKEGLKFGDEEKKDKKRLEKYKESFEPLTDYLKDVLSDDVEKVTVTNRLAETPAILVTSQYGYSANMQRILKSQTLSDPERARMMMGKKILEVNPRHPIVTQLKNKVEEGSDDEETKDLANVLYDTALLNSGFDMEKPENFASRMYRLMQNL